MDDLATIFMKIPKKDGWLTIDCVIETAKMVNNSDTRWWNSPPAFEHRKMSEKIAAKTTFLTTPTHFRRESGGSFRNPYTKMSAFAAFFDWDGRESNTEGRSFRTSSKEGVKFIHQSFFAARKNTFSGKMMVGESSIFDAQHVGHYCREKPLRQPRKFAMDDSATFCTGLKEV